MKLEEDAKLSEHISKLHLNHCLVDVAKHRDENHRLFLLLKNIHEAADDAMHRLNELQTMEE
jgi:hypothetical protein